MRLLVSDHAVYGVSGFAGAGSADTEAGGLGGGSLSPAESQRRRENAEKISCVFSALSQRLRDSAGEGLLKRIQQNSGGRLDWAFRGDCGFYFYVYLAVEDAGFAQIDFEIGRTGK